MASKYRHPYCGQRHPGPHPENLIQIKSVGIDKGRAALHWLSQKAWDFILAIGDDWTDEDLFAVLPESAYSIKVGMSPSKAKFNLDSVQEVRALIHRLAKG